MFNNGSNHFECAPIQKLAIKFSKARTNYEQKVSRFMFIVLTDYYIFEFFKSSTSQDNMFTIGTYEFVLVWNYTADFFESVVAVQWQSLCIPSPLGPFHTKESRAY